MALTRQQLEQQLVAAHRSGNVQAAQQAAYAIRAYDQAPLSAQVPSVNAPPPIERVPKPTFGSWLGNVGIGYGEELGRQVRDIGGMVERGVSAFTQDPLKASAAAVMSVLEPWRQGLTQPVQTAKDVGAGVVETGRQMATQAQSGPIGLGGVAGQIAGLPGPDLPGRRKPTMAELDVYHGTPHTFEPEEGAPLGRFQSEKIGTGEGAQAYGHGLYLAESPDIAGGYAYNLGYRAGNLPTINGKPITDLYRRIEDKAATMSPEASQIEYQKLDFLERLMQEQGTPAKVLAGLKGQEGVYPQAVEWFKKEVAPKYKGPGTTYKVDLPDSKIEQMLDWDKPFAKQSEYVKQIIKDSGLYKEYKANLSDFATPMATRNKEFRGENFLAFVENKFQSEARQKVRNGELIEDTSRYGAAKAAEYLQSLGIPGIKYLDAASRAEGKKTRNFVVFPGEEQNLTVLERNGERAQVAPKAAAPAKPRIATWFSGGGTVESALPNHERVMAAEYNPQINEQANKTFGTSFPARDVNKIDPQELKAAKPDLFHASPVCKNFSAAKTMRGATELDRESANSVANAIRVATPPVVTVENVPQYADTALFKHITDALDDKGYKWDVVIHDAADYGAPQSRKRMLLRAVREGELPPLPPKTGGKDWYAAVSDLLPDAPDAVIPPVERRRLDDMIAAGKLDPSKPIITMGGSGFKGTWAAANAGGVAPTLKAANEKPRVIMPDGTVKTVTGRMMARLMGLGDDVPVPENQTLAKTVLGNGVSGDVTKALIAPLLNRTK